MWITGTGTDSNLVSGNFIGTDVSGSIAIANGSAPVTGADQESYGGGVVIMNGASSNVVGTTGQSADNAGQGNLISGNANDGVDIYGASTDFNVVAGNMIGTNLSGTSALANVERGVLIAAGASSNVIGTNGDGLGDAAEGNLISGNFNEGVMIVDALTNSNVLAGNLIGTNAAGTAAVPNGGAVDSVGVLIDDGPEFTRVGTNGDGVSDLVERNVISGNLGYDGLMIQTANDNVVAGNYIGTTADGLHALPNVGNGIEIKRGSQGNLIGTNAAGVDDGAEQQRDLGKR